MNELLSTLPPAWEISLALVLALIVAWVVSSMARWLLRGRAKLGTATSIVITIVATALGLLVAGALDHNLRLLSLPAVMFTLGFSVGGIALYAAVAAHFQPQRAPEISVMLASGESDRVEFKSTARVNLHTGQRDEKMEQVIAKTVCAFLNADGGTLVIGVDDAGTPLGLDADLATMKAPDLDRYELWLRDLLTATLGQNAAALAQIEFPEVAGPDEVARPVCAITCR
ncbi:MAG: ATP-binding protein, partial [Actinobacteria bacterium]|nr:ATP-binding protein [Actinomycetota bacterium]